MAENVLNTSNLTNYTETFAGIEQENGDWSDETLQKTRYIIQRIVVPCLVSIGIAGNLLTVIVLTRYTSIQLRFATI